MEEISNALVEEGTVQLEDRQAVMTRPLENLSLPNTVQAVIRALLDRLDRHARESLCLASVIGREFSQRLLERISVSREHLSQSLETLKTLELIQQIQVVPEAEYMFKHVITQEVTYETLLKQKRKELHRFVGQAIEELYADRLEEFYEMLAFHFLRGADWSRAYKYNREAGLKALSLSALIETLSYFETALDALKKLPRTKNHIQKEIDLRFNMRAALFPLGKHDDWANNIRVAEALAKEISDNARLANAYNYLSSHHWICSRHKEAIQLGEEGLRLAEAAGDFSVQMTTRFHLGIPLLFTGEYERQVALHREVAERLSGSAALERHGLSSVPSITTRGFLAWGLVELGEFEEAEMWTRQGIRLAEQVKNDFSMAWILTLSGLAFLRKGELNPALKLLRKANTLVRETDLQSMYSFVIGCLGDAYLLSDRPDDALPILEEAVRPQNLNSSIIPSIFPITILSEAYRLNGKVSEALRTAAESLRIFDQSQERCFGAWALYVMAKIQSEQNSGQMEETKHTYHQVIKLAEELKMRPLLAHCRMERGQFYSKIGENELLKALDLYRSLNMGYWLPKTEALLRDTTQPG
jgi:tetratricopeptide (TPR) repeat protein